MAIEDTALNRFLRDPNRTEKFILELYYYDPSTGVDDNVMWFSTHGKLLDPVDGLVYCRQGLQSFSPYAVDPLSSSDLLGVIKDPIRGGQQGTARIEGFDGSCDDLLARGYIFDGHDYAIYICGTYRYAAYALTTLSPTKIRSGVIVGQPLVDLAGATFQISDYSEKFEAPVQNKRFPGGDYSLRLRTGTADYVTFGTPSAVDLTTTITIAAKLRLKTNSATWGILSWRLSTTTTYPFAFGVTSGNKLFFAATGVTTVSTTAVLTNEVPYQVAVTVQGSTATFHIMDLIAGTTVTETITLSATTRSAHVGGNLRIGHHNGANPTDAIIDWVATWNILQPLEYLQELRYRQLSALETAESSLVLLAKIEEGSGTTTADSSLSALTGTFGGTPTWILSLNGGTSLEGTQKPDVWGAVSRHPMLLVWPLTRIYCVSGDKINLIGGVTEGGASLTAGTDYTDQETFLAASTTAARYDTCITNLGSFVRLGSNATLPLAANVRGALAADGSTYVNTCDGIVAAVAELRAGLSSSILVGFATGSTAVLGISVTEDMTCRDLISMCLSSVGAIAWFSRIDPLVGNTYFMGLLVPTYRGASGSIAGNIEFNAASIEPLPVEAPPKLVRVNYIQNYVPLSEQEIASSIASTTAQRALQLEAISVVEYIQTKRKAQSEVELDTVLTTEASAREALKRIAVIHRLSPRLIKVTVPSSAMKYDIGDFVGLCVSDVNTSTGLPSPRLEIGHGGGTTKFSGFRALNFQSSEYIDLGTSASFALSTFTIQTIFRCPVNSTGFLCLTSRETNSSVRNWWLGVWDGATKGYDDGALTFLTRVGGATTYNLGTKYSIRDGDWHTATIVANSASSMIYLYLDGVLVDSRSCPTVDTPATKNVYIGCETGPIRQWNGQIREWAFWNSARTADQIYNDRHGVLSPSAASSYFLFDKNGVTDQGSIGATATLSGSTSTITEYMHPYDTWLVVGVEDDNDPANGTGAVKLVLWRRN